MRIRLSQLRRIIKEEVKALVEDAQISGSTLHDYLETDPLDDEHDEFIKQWNSLDTPAKIGYWKDRSTLMGTGELKRSDLMSSAGDTEMRRLGLSQSDFDDAKRSTAAAARRAADDARDRKRAASIDLSRKRYALTGR